MAESIACRVTMWLILIMSALAPSLGLGCSSRLDPLEAEEQAALDGLQAEIDDRIEASHEAEPLPALSRDELDERELRLHRRQVADQMRAEVAEAMAPLVFAAALFAPEGTADLLLTVLPVERIGGAAVELARHAYKVRKRSKKAKELARLSDEFHAALMPEAKDFMRLAGKLEAADRRALKVIFDYTQSPAVIAKLMHKQISGDANVRWIADRLERGQMDYSLVERFTFDAGVVEDITLHDAHLSWGTLQRVVDGAAVDPKARTMLAGKVQGLMGERAARRIVRSREFMQRHLKRVDRDVVSGHGLHYGVPYSGQSSIDIVAYTLHDEAIFVEVKTWSAETWRIPGQTDKILDQLRRHDGGIAEIIRHGDNYYRTTRAKILMVEESGYMAALDRVQRADFVQQVEGMGWVIETVPSSDIRTFAELIDAIR